MLSEREARTIIGGRALSQKELSAALSQELESQGYAQSTDKDADVSVWLGEDEASGWLTMQMNASAGKGLSASLAARLQRDMDVFCITMLKDFECTLEHCVGEMRGDLGLPPGHAARADAPVLAAECDQPIGAAPAAAEAREAASVSRFQSFG